MLFELFLHLLILFFSSGWHSLHAQWDLFWAAAAAFTSALHIAGDEVGKIAREGGENRD